MDKYMRRFVLASLCYLGLAALFGILAGLTDIGYTGYFAHTHFNLLGFVAMMIFGIGYFVLPRFSGTELRWPAWVPVHFWLGNIGLIGMVIFRGLQVETGAAWAEVAFVIMATAEAITLFMFIVNIWATIAPGKRRMATSGAQTPAAPPIRETPVDRNSRIASLIDRTPSVQQVLVEQGLKALGVPGHLDKVRKSGVTLGIAAQNHGLEVEKLISAVKSEMARVNERPPVEAPKPAAPFSTESLIGAVLEQHPGTRAVFQRYFGDGCFDCPGQADESIDMACSMHGIDPAVFMDELYAAANESSIG